MKKVKIFQIFFDQKQKPPGALMEDIDNNNNWVFPRDSFDFVFWSEEGTGRDKCYKTYLDCNLRFGVISKNVSFWQTFPFMSNLWELLWSTHMSAEKAQLAKICLVRKCLPEWNMVAYYDKAYITLPKSFITCGAETGEITRWGKWQIPLTFFFFLFNLPFLFKNEDLSIFNLLRLPPSGALCCR